MPELSDIPETAPGGPVSGPGVTPPSGQPSPFPHLDPHYRPATEDSGIVVRFMGNTARVAEMRFLGQVDPFQLLALGEFLKFKATQMIALAEAKELAERQAQEEAARRNKPVIATPGGHFVFPDQEDAMRRGGGR